MPARIISIAGVGSALFPALIIALLRSLPLNWLETMPHAASVCVFTAMCCLILATLVSGYITVLSLVIGGHTYL